MQAHISACDKWTLGYGDKYIICNNCYDVVCWRCGKLNLFALHDTYLLVLPPLSLSQLIKQSYYSFKSTGMMLYGIIMLQNKFNFGSLKQYIFTIKVIRSVADCKPACPSSRIDKNHETHSTGTLLCKLAVTEKITSRRANI